MIRWDHLKYSSVIDRYHIKKLEGQNQFMAMVNFLNFLSIIFYFFFQLIKQNKLKNCWIVGWKSILANINYNTHKIDFIPISLIADFKANDWKYLAEFSSL